METDRNNEKDAFIPSRYVQAVMAFLAVIVSYSLRVNIFVGIVAMTLQKTSNPDILVFNWDSATKGTILSSFFCGYLITQIPAGYFSHKYGHKRLLFGAILSCGIVTLLTPFITTLLGWKALCAARVFIGLGQGFLIPCSYTLVSKWAPVKERSRFISFVLGGLQVGTVCTLFVAGYLADSSWGWPSIFYATGLPAIIWSLVWIFVGADSPATHKTISQKERDYIQSLLVNSSEDSNKMRTPWKAMCTSTPLLALIIAHSTNNWGFWTLLTLLPSYLNSVHNFSMKDNGLLTAMPYCVMWVLTMLIARIEDYNLKKGYLPVSVSRKMWNSLAQFGGAAGFIGLTFMGSNTTNAVILMTITVAINSGQFCGFLSNHHDLSPNFAGVLMGITNCISNTFSILAPLTAGFILKDETNIEQWNLVFYIAAAMFFIGNLVFITFGSTAVQPWNNSPLKLQQKAEDDFIPARYIQAVMAFLAMIVSFSLRVNIFVGIVAMTSRKSSNPNFPVFDWDSATKGTILSSFFWGYVVTQIPAGYFSHRYGHKYLLFGAILMCGVLTIFTPFITTFFGWKALCAARIFVGLGQGFLVPCSYNLVSKWAPPKERGRFFSFVFGGIQVGTVCTLFVAGYLADSSWGWPSIFYITGLSAIIWSLVWFFVGANSPATHKTISQKEREYIQSLLVNSSLNSHKMKTPWKDISKSIPVLAALIAHCTNNWGFWTLLSLLPSYLNSVHNFNMKDNGLLTALPYCVMWILTILISRIEDYNHKKKYLPVSVTRKMWNSFAQFGGAAGLIGMTFTGSNTTLAVILMTVTVATNSGHYCGFLSNHLDLSPNFAGVLMGITNCISNTFSFLAPLAAGFILKDETNIEQWNVVFYIAAFMFFCGNLFFITFGSTKVQPWNNSPLKSGKTLEEICINEIIPLE